MSSLVSSTCTRVVSDTLYMANSMEIISGWRNQRYIFVEMSLFANERFNDSETVITKCNGRLLPDSYVRLEIAVHQLDLSRGNHPRTKWNVKLTFRHTLRALFG